MKLVIRADDAGHTDPFTETEKYDPIRFYTENQAKMLKLPDNATMMHAWHPGYVDYFVCRLGDYGPNARNYITTRPVGVHALCSPEVKGLAPGAQNRAGEPQGRALQHPRVPKPSARSGQRALHRQIIK